MEWTEWRNPNDIQVNQSFDWLCNRKSNRLKTYKNERISFHINCDQSIQSHQSIIGFTFSRGECVHHHLSLTAALAIPQKPPLKAFLIDSISPDGLNMPKPSLQYVRCLLRRQWETLFPCSFSRIWGTIAFSFSVLVVFSFVFLSLHLSDQRSRCKYDAASVIFIGNGAEMWADERA